ncbi:MAG: hypothetical protein MUE63_12820 [Xanthomonadales bacterium]|nr:hypothetical protein [Xanthomonadales bacterium]
MLPEIEAFRHVDRSDRLERLALPENLPGFAPHQRKQCVFAGRAAVRVMAPGEEPGEIAVIEEADSERGCEKHAAVFVDMKRSRRATRGPGLADEDSVFLPEHPRRVGEADEDALRSVLYEPAAAVIATILPVDEGDQAAMGDALSLQAPVTAPVERQPAVTGGDVGPSGDGREIDRHQ